MKPGVILVNTARGALVDEAALIAALKSGHIRHAGLDVFHAEPLKPDHPLAKLPNVTLTAHAAFRTLEASMTLLRRAIDIVNDDRRASNTPACRRHRWRSRCRGCGAPWRSPGTPPARRRPPAGRCGASRSWPAPRRAPAPPSCSAPWRIAASSCSMRSVCVCAGMDDVDIDVVAVAERGEALGEIRHRRVDRAADQEIRPRRARGAADDVDDVAVRLP